VGDDSWGEIERAAEAGDRDRVIDLCLVLDESDRRRLSKQAGQLARRLEMTRADWIVTSRSVTMNKPRQAQSRAAGAALMCLGPAPGRRTRSWAPSDRLEQIVRSRPRAWRDRWALWVIEQEWDHTGWRVLRTLVREDECDKPEGPEYVRAMIRHAGWLPFDGDGPAVGRHRRDLHAALLADRDLLETDVWRIFELEEKTLSAAWYDWDATLIRLSAEGVISRDRLIDVCLAALRRDFSAGVAQSFTAFHDELAPTVGERADRLDEYVTLLASPVDSTVGFALRHLTAVERGGRALDGRTMLDHLAPALIVRPKGHAKRAVALLAKIIKREPALADEGLDLAIGALAHEAAEVQDAAIALIERNADALVPAQRDRLSEVVALLDPAVRPRAAALTGAVSIEQSAQSNAPIDVPSPPSRDADTVPRLRADEALMPVNDVEVLIELAGFVLERADDPNELERFVDGLSRLCDRPLPEAQRAALGRHARSEFARWPAATMTQSRTAAAVLIGCWLERRAPIKPWFPVSRGPRAALGRRLAGISRRVGAGRGHELLSAPTHRGGYIDARVLAVRLARASDVDDIDLAQALLRIAPEGRDVALADLRDSGGEAAAVVRAALGGGDQPPKRTARLPASWDSVEVLANPDGVVLEPRPANEPPPWSSVRPTVEVAPPLSPARFLGQYEQMGALSVDPGLQRWLSLIWPAHHEIYYGMALRIVEPPAPWISRTERERLAASLEPMLDRGDIIGAEGYRLLAEALGSNERDRFVAADVTIAAIGTRRLSGVTLGVAIAGAMQREKAVPDRWGTSLDPVPGQSALHAHEIQRALEACLGELRDHELRLTKVLDLLRRVAQDADAQVQNNAARSWLEALPPRSKSGRLAQAILSVTGDGSARGAEAAALAGIADA
jgi:hypothetical protein